MKPTRNSIIAVIIWTIIYLAGGVIDGHATTPYANFEYGPYPYWVRTECRELACGDDGIDYARAMRCAENTMRLIREEELRKAQVDFLQSETELNRELTRKVKEN